MRAASVFYSGMFNSDDFILPQQVMYKKNLSSKDPLHQELKNLMTDEDILAAEVVADGQMYKNGDLIVLKMVDCDTAKVGLIQSVLIKNNKVHFFCKVYTCVRNWLQFFESTACDDVSSFFDADKVADFKPLVKRGTSTKFVFVLHHRVSFAYN